MRYIDLNEIANLQAVIDWKKNASLHQKNVNSMTNKSDRTEYFSDNPYWGELKNTLKNVYGNVCWYTETAIDNQYGDVDHFRPKAKSTDEKNHVILENGYYHLAYDYTNYRLSAQLPNESAKKNIFPVKDTTNAGTTKEIPKLIDPCCQDDVKLIGYSEDGSVTCNSSDAWDIARVKCSKKTYMLERFDDARKAVYLDCKITAYSLKTAYNLEDYVTLKALQEKIALMLGKNAPYASVAFSHLKNHVNDKLEDSSFRLRILNYMESVYLK